MSKSLGLVFRMENEGGVVAGEEVTADETLAVETAAADATAEVESATGDVTEVVTGIENAGEASAELSAVEDSLEQAVEDGDGVSPREAEHIQARLERVATLLGTDTGAMGLTFRKESFGGQQSRLAATKMRLEFVKEWGKKIWEMIVRAWEWVKNAVTNLWGSLTKNSETLLKRLETLEKQAEEKAKSGATASKDKIKTRAKDISVNGQFGLVSLLRNVPQYTAILEGTHALVDPSKTDKLGDTPESLKAHAAEVTKLFDRGEKVTKLDAGAGEGAKPTIALPGNKTVAVVPKSVSAGENEVASFTVAVKESGTKAMEEYPALGFDQIREVLRLAKAGATTLRELDKYAKETNNIVQANIKHAQSMISNTAAIQSKGRDKESEKAADKTSLSVIRAAHSLNVSLVDVASKNMPKAIYDACSAAADVVAASISAASGGKKADAAKAEEKK